MKKAVALVPFLMGETPLAMAAEDTMLHMMDQTRQCGLAVGSVHVFCLVDGRILPAGTVADTIKRLKQQFGIRNYVERSRYDGRFPCPVPIAVG